ncbi:casein kinase ii subunit beta [Anaeramoeba flamelloides]|uniref:Casein kinase II subunit beta n=1 Tax=Anaeramoeba flamelloides TaxID=1746091 RepID=A0AAV8A2N8_9EUKA|nr:casein kinase ii subunit beta [Anaeramoeba flamelloides]
MDLETNKDKSPVEQKMGTKSEPSSSSGSGSSSESSYSSSSDSSLLSWTEWFCDLDDHEWFCIINEDYLMDNFNFYGLQKYIKNYSYTIDLIRDLDNEQFEFLTEEEKQKLEKEAFVLYGLMHARYIITYSGMRDMRKKIKNQSFGRCQRYLCRQTALIPIGLSDKPNKSKVKVFCPNCQKIYHPPKCFEWIDGAFFGTSFPHFLLSCYPQLRPKKKKTKTLIPKIFGFQIHTSVPQYYTGEKKKKIENKRIIIKGPKKNNFYNQIEIEVEKEKEKEKEKEETKVIQNQKEIEIEKVSKEDGQIQDSDEDNQQIKEETNVN